MLTMKDTNTTDNSTSLSFKSCMSCKFWVPYNDNARVGKCSGITIGTIDRKSFSVIYPKATIVTDCPGVYIECTSTYYCSLFELKE